LSQAIATESQLFPVILPQSAESPYQKTRLIDPAYGTMAQEESNAIVKGRKKSLTALPTSSNTKAHSS
jgi:hypothetical protein